MNKHPENKDNAAYLNDGDKPKVKELLDQISEAINNAAHWLARKTIAESVIWNIWENQSPDGKKHAATDDEEPPVPWEGASDTRIRLAAAKVLEVSSREAVALSRANIKISGREGLDHVQAVKSTNLLKWLVDSQMGMDASAAANIGRFNRACYGLNIASVEWKRDEKIIPEDVDFWKFARLNGFAFPEGATLPDVNKSLLDTSIDMPVNRLQELARTVEFFMTPDSQAAAEETVAKFSPDSSKKRVRAAVEAWRRGEPAKLLARRTVAECPVWDSMIPFDEVFFPYSTEKLQDAPWIAVREFLSEQQVLQQKYIDGWNGDFCDAVIKSKGKTTTLGLPDKLEAGELDMPYSLEKVRTESDDQLCEIFYIYYRAVSDEGVEAIYRLVASNNIETGDDGNPLYGKNEIYPSVDGEYPFVEQVYWRTDKTLLSCVGIPWLLRFAQDNIKNMRDKRLDVTDISTIPPIIRDARSSREKLQLGPASILYENVAGTTKWMDPPSARIDLPIELENSELRDSARLVGSTEAGVSPDIIKVIQEADINEYLKSMRQIFKKTWRLAQEFLPTIVVMRVTGSSQKPYETSAEEIRGEFDLSVTFDPSNLDEKIVQAKIAAIRELMGIDQNGIIDGNFAVKYSAMLIDPNFAEIAITDESMGQQKVIIEEKQNIAMMMTGQSAPLKKEEAGAKLRLQIIMQEIRQNPVVSTAYQQNPRIRAAFDQRVKNLQMQIAQQQNKTIGALGVNPDLKSATAAN